MTKDDALDLALAALESCDQVYGSEGSYQYFSQAKVDKAITAIKQARSTPVQEPVYHLRQYGDVTKGQLDRYMATGDINPQPAPVQEPVAWYRDEDGIRIYYESKCWDDATPLYTTPPAAPDLQAELDATTSLRQIIDAYTLASGPGRLRLRGTKSQPQQEPVAWPDGLIDRIKAAEQRIQDGHAPRRIPADPTDVDLVLAEVRYLLEGKQPPFWIATTPPAAVPMQSVENKENT